MHFNQGPLCFVSATETYGASRTRVQSFLAGRPNKTSSKAGGGLMPDATQGPLWLPDACAVSCG